MRLKLFVLLSILFLLGCRKEEPNIQEINVIPLPQKFEITNQTFHFNENTIIYFDNNNRSFEKVARYLNNEINKKLGLSLSVEKYNGSVKRNGVHLIASQNSALEEEGYAMNINKRNIEIEAIEANGAFYAVQTLFQMMIIAAEDGKFNYTPAIQGAKIEDQPQFTWRGMHLDVCRHFFPKEFIKKYIDMLAMHKMNTFHWHLTEDQGWRIEIKKYPKLTEVGAWRDETMVGKNWNEFNGVPHGGFYTQEDIKEIVAYAADRFITIVPEIEMPGHSSAALAAYPQFGCSGGPYEVQKTWGVFEDVYCAGNDSTFIFLQDILSEVIELFPGTYIHIGGDECPKGQWEKCPKCQARIKEEALENEHELQSYFIKRIEKFLVKNGKKLIGWDEILEGGLAPEATVMSWRGTEGGIKSARMGHDVVMSPNSHCYFDHYQGDKETEPLAIGGFTDLEKVYHYNPIPEELTAEEANHILGAQANIWTEYMATTDHVEYMALPRMCALAEVVWSEPEPGYENFLRRLEEHIILLKLAGYNFRPLDLD